MLVPERVGTAENTRQDFRGTRNHFAFARDTGSLGDDAALWAPFPASGEATRIRKFDRAGRGLLSR